MTVIALSYAALLVANWYRKARNRGRHARGLALANVVELSPEEERFVGGAHRSEKREGFELQDWHHGMLTGEHRMVGERFEDVIAPLVFLEDADTPLFYELSPLLPAQLDLESMTGAFPRGWVDELLASVPR